MQQKKQSVLKMSTDCFFYMFGNEHEIFTEWFRLNYTADKVACNAEFIPF